MVLAMMRRDRWLFTGLLLALPACQRSETGTDGAEAAASASAGKLDKMQLSSARRVALESAATAMQRRDLERLKQLDLWVKNRAQVAIFEPDDLRSLELAISCLERASPPPEALGQLAQLESGSLRGPARAVCGGTAH
jgi:hypothetical protein